MRGTIAEVLAHFKETEPKGEFVLIIGGIDKKHGKTPSLHVAS